MLWPKNFANLLTNLGLVRMDAVTSKPQTIKALIPKYVVF